jgi:hypothetical protein
VVHLAGITAPDLLLLQTLIVVVALEFFRKVAKLCADWCSVIVQFVCVIAVVVVVLLLLLLVVVATLLVEYFALLVGYFAVTNVTFSALYVGLYLPLCRVFFF